MKIVREFIKNGKVLHLLKIRYYCIATVLILLSGAIGLAIMMFFISYVLPMFGIDPNTRMGSDAVEKFVLVTLFLLFSTSCIYAGHLIVAGSFSFVMYKLANFTRAEAINFALYSGYPAYWFGQQP